MRDCLEALSIEVYGCYLDEIRKHDPDVPVVLCTESQAMWREFAPQLGLKPGDYACGCGPQSVPGAKTIAKLEMPAECA